MLEDFNFIETPVDALSSSLRFEFGKNLKTSSSNGLNKDEQSKEIQPSLGELS